jgi:thioredoxin-like negative regulator of GroEL
VLSQAVHAYNRLVSTEALWLLDEAMRLAREGDVEGACNLLREARAAGPAPDALSSLLFQLVSRRGVTDEALDVASAALAAARTPAARSTWALRRGLGHLERGQREPALADLQLVLKLRANPDHVEQAGAALLRVAQLPRKR